MYRDSGCVLFEIVTQVYVSWIVNLPLAIGQGLVQLPNHGCLKKSHPHETGRFGNTSVGDQYSSGPPAGVLLSLWHLS